MGDLFTPGFNLIKNSAARCCASAADPPFPHNIIFPPFLTLENIFKIAKLTDER